MAADYILGIDQGTTGSTVLVINLAQRGRPSVVARATVNFTQHFPRPSWVEHDLDEIWTSVASACTEALTVAKSKDAAFNVKRIAAIGITNQRETLCAFERDSGRALARAIVWQCKRSASICESLRAEGLNDKIRQRTGLVLDPYFSGSKIRWLMENNAALAAQARQGNALFGTIDTFLLYRLTGGKSFATEASNVSRTLLYDLHAKDYADDLLALFKVPSRSALPEVRSSAGSFGKTAGLDFLPDGIPITGILGDQQAALAGQTCFQEGEAKCTYGTGAFLLINIGDKPFLSRAGLLTTVAWSLDGKLTYALEGSVFIAGAAVQFIRDQLKLIQHASEVETLASHAVAAPETYFVPALSGLGAPHWEPLARGAFLGLTRGTSQADIARATLEGIAFSVNDVVGVMAKDFKSKPSVLRVDGGAAANNLLMQLQADISDVEVDRPINLETTAMGAALFAGLGVGLYGSLDELRHARESARTFSPTVSSGMVGQRQAKLEGWQRAVAACRVFAGSAH